ncbi:MAG TPA: aminotransferase class III-fold pyridoxal phosphate-dependent enzyme [Pseudonocardiaceae bacterium]
MSGGVLAVFDSSTYHIWHGLSPMADFFRLSDPEMFLVGGSGCHVTDRSGRRYLDARSSMWNVTLGYSCEPVKEAMRRQLDVLPSGTVMRYEHPAEVAARYAAALAGVLPEPLRQIRFGNTGSQMTEAAVMLSRFHRRMTGEPGRQHVVAVHGSYHGTGPLASALTGEEFLHDLCGPIDTHVGYAQTPPAESCEGSVQNCSCVRPVLDVIDSIGAEQVTAVILEPVIGSYVLSPRGHYLESLVAQCRARGIHFIADEVTTGAGRTGRMTLSERLPEPPDMIVLGKGLSAGYFPLAALAVAQPLYDELADSGHRVGFPNGSTTDGHPIGMAAGLAVLDVLTAPGFLEGVRRTGEHLRGLIMDVLGDRDEVRGVRGEGLMLGVDLAYPDGTPWSVGDTNQLRLVCRDHGLLTSFTRGVLPLLPPLVITDDECAELVDRLGAALLEFRKRTEG